MRFVVVAFAKNGSLVATSGMPWAKASSMSAGSVLRSLPCRGAAARHRGGRRTAAPVRRSDRGETTLAGREGRIERPAWAPAQGDQPFGFAFQPGELEVGCSFGAVSRNARELSRIRLR